MALENNLGVQADRLGPQIETYGVAQARAAYGSNLTSTTTNAERDLAADGLPDASGGTTIRHERQFQDQRRRPAVRAVGRRALYGRHRRVAADDEQPDEPFNPQLDSSLAASLHAAAAAELQDRRPAAEPAAEPEEQEIADVQLRQTLTQTVAQRSQRLLQPGRTRSASSRSRRSRSSCARRRSGTTSKRWKLGTMAPIDIVQAQAEVASTEEQVIVAEGQIQTAEDILRVLIMNPSQPDFWTTKLEPADSRRSRRSPSTSTPRSRTRWPTAPISSQSRKRSDQTDISMKYLRNQKLPALDVIGNYNVQGVAGTQFQFDRNSATFPPPSSASRSAASATRCATCSPTTSRRGACAQPQLSDRDERRRCRARAGAPAARAADDQPPRSRDDRSSRRSATPAAGHDGPQAGRDDTESARSSPSRTCRPKRSGSPSACPTRSVCLQAQRDLTSQLNRS